MKSVKVIIIVNGDSNNDDINSANGSTSNNNNTNGFKNGNKYSFSIIIITKVDYQIPNYKIKITLIYLSHFGGKNDNRDKYSKKEKL